MPIPWSQMLKMPEAVKQERLLSFRLEKEHRLDSLFLSLPNRQLKRGMDLNSIYSLMCSHSLRL
eukprot:2544-Amphidinium_carterae.1